MRKAGNGVVILFRKYSRLFSICVCCGSFLLFGVKFSLAVCGRSAVTHRDRCARQGGCGLRAWRMRAGVGRTAAKRPKMRRLLSPLCRNGISSARPVQHAPRLSEKSPLLLKESPLVFPKSRGLLATICRRKSKNSPQSRQKCNISANHLTDIENNANFAMRRFVVGRTQLYKTSPFHPI